MGKLGKKFFFLLVRLRDDGVVNFMLENEHQRGGDEEHKAPKEDEPCGKMAYLKFF